MATDADLPGRIAAERAHWLLSQHGVHPLMATLSPGSDPGDLLTRRGRTALTDALNNTEPLADVLLHERLTNLTGPAALAAATTVAATGHPHDWDDTAHTIAQTLNIPGPDARQAILEAVQAWHVNPRTIVVSQLGQAGDVKARLETAAEQSHTVRQRPVATRADVGLSAQPYGPSSPPRTPTHTAGVPR